MDVFLELVQANGVLGLVTGLAVLVTVFALTKGGVVVSREQKQSANVILSILLAGVALTDPELADVVVAAIASVGSALAYEGIRWAGKHFTAAKTEDVRAR